MNSEKENIPEKEEQDELLVDSSNILKVFLSEERQEMSQEEEIEKFELKKEKQEQEILSEEALKVKKEKEAEEEEELKKVKTELLASLERVKAIVKRIYGNVDSKTKSEFKENKRVIQKGKRRQDGGVSQNLNQDKDVKGENQEKGIER